MAAGNVTLYSAAGFAIGSGGILLGSDNFNVILLTTAYNPVPNTDALYSDVSASEVAAGGGYATGGQALTGATWTLSGATSTFAAQSVVWAGSTIAARYALVVKRAGVSLSGTDKLLCFVDLTGSGNGTSTASTFQVNWNNASTPSSASVIFTQTHAP